MGFRGLTGSTTPTSFLTSSLTLDTHKSACIFSSPINCGASGKAIHKIHFRVATVTTDAALDVRVETVDSTGSPTGTLFATNTNGNSPTAHAASTWYSVTLTADAAPAMGDKFAIVINRSGAGTISLTIADGFEGSGLVWSGLYPRRATFGTVWTKDDVAPNVGIELADGTFLNHGGVMHTGVLDSGSAFAFKVGDATNEEGNYFTAPFSARVIGMFARLKQGSAAEGQYEFNLYDGSLSAPASALGTFTEDSTSHLNNNYGTHIGFFAAPAYIIEGKPYRACVYCSAATSGVTLERFRVSAQAHLIGTPGGDGTYRTSRVKAGPGTFSNTVTEQFWCVGLVIDEIIELNRHPGMGAGLAA